MNAKLFTKIIIANRGEIACRIIRTCKALNIISVAVYSDVDKDSEHVRLADEAIYIGHSDASKSYLNKQAIINAALQCQANAVHPGYGFLSENDEFAEMVESSGMVFIGPKASSMRAMGSKAGAKALMIENNVPVIPGYSGDNQDSNYLFEQAKQVGYPLMIKAAHGGGGKGMRIVHSADTFVSSLESCQREALNAFGKDRVLLERYIEKPRHIEFQIFADEHGNTIHLGERECSAQRRFQKVIEESPSPFLSPALRAEMADAAIKSAKAVNYLNAGTVEFIVSQSGEFFFMEINSRFQVEHPVTEMVTGLDLVKWQIEVAAGLALPKKQNEIVSNGHAIEVRIYAEDPSKNFMPGSGVIRKLELPKTNASLRIDSGFREGNLISVYYDPMLAKLIVHADSRVTALTALQNALAQCQIFGLPSNIRFLEHLIAHPKVQAGEIDTGFLDKHLDEVLPESNLEPQGHRIAAAYYSLQQARQRLSNTDSANPWSSQDFWRTHGKGKFRINLKFDQQFEPHLIQQSNSTIQVEYNNQITSAIILDETNQHLSIDINGQHLHFHAFQFQDELVIHDGKNRTNWRILQAGSNATDTELSLDGFIRSPMPGKLVLVHVLPGQPVIKGQELAVMEAMKMELSIKAPCDGTISECLAEVGAVLDADIAILSWEPNNE
jgi:3-methylcrotonyl-CoA carboxylase alpha subunit